MRKLSNEPTSGHNAYTSPYKQEWKQQRVLNGEKEKNSLIRSKDSMLIHSKGNEGWDGGENGHESLRGKSSLAITKFFATNGLNTSDFSPFIQNSEPIPHLDTRPLFFKFIEAH